MMLFILVMLLAAYSPITAKEPHAFRGMFTGRCRGDGLYYNDEDSFVMCISRNYYIQPCPPGTKNRPLRGYNEDEQFVNFQSFCDVNLVNFGYRHPLPRKYESHQTRLAYEPPKVVPLPEERKNYRAQTESMYKEPHKYTSNPMIHRELLGPRDSRVSDFRGKDRGRLHVERQEKGHRHSPPSEGKGRHRPKYEENKRPRDYRQPEGSRVNRNNIDEDDKSSYLYMVISMPKDMVSKIKDYEAKQRKGQRQKNTLGYSKEEEQRRGSISYHKPRSPEYGPMSRPPYGKHERPPPPPPQPARGQHYGDDRAYYNSKDHGGSHFPPPRPRPRPERYH